MKKNYLLIIMLLATMGLVACGGNDTEESAEVATGYSWVEDGVMLYINAPQSETVDLLEEEPDYFEAASCAYDGVDKIYTYNNFVLTFVEGEEDDELYLITFTSDLVTTDEGIYIGGTYDDVIGAYGTPSSETDTLLTYEKEESQLRFILSDGIIVSIEICGEL